MLVVTCLFMYSCSSASPEHELVFDQATFVQMQADWESHGITSYAFDVNFYSGGRAPGFPTFRVTVKDGIKDNIEVIENYDYWDGYFGEQHKIADFNMIIQMAGTIPAVFAWAETLREEHSVAKRTIDIIYNDKYNFPEEIKKSVYAPYVGGGVHLIIDNFQPVQ